jgi:hypothetical protein
MSLQPSSIPPVPEETARVARAAFRKGNVYLRLRDELGALYDDSDFAQLFPAVGETLRATLNALATEAPEWVRGFAPAEWYERYGRRIEESRLPRGKAAREEYARTVGADGFTLLEALEAQSAPAGLKSLPAGTRQDGCINACAVSASVGAGRRTSVMVGSRTQSRTALEMRRRQSSGTREPVPQVVPLVVPLYRFWSP